MKIQLTRFLKQVFFLTLPFQLGKHFWPSWSFVWGIKIDYLSPTIYLQDIFLFFLFLAYFPRLIKSFKGSIIRFWPWFLTGGGLVLINLFFSFRPGVSFFSWLRVGEGVFLFWLLTRERKENQRLIGGALIFWLFLLGLISLAQVIKQASLGGVFWWLGERSFDLTTPGIARVFLFDRYWLRPYATFSHPNSLAGFLLVSLILVFSQGKRFFCQKKEKIACFLGLMGLGLTLARGVILTGLFLFFIFLFFQKRKKKWAFLTVVFLVIFLVFSFSFSWQPSLSRRFFLLVAAKNMIFDSWWRGVGKGSFVAALPFYWPFSWSSSCWLQPVHNIYLLFLAEVGVGGAVFLFWLARRFWGFLGYRWALAAIALTGLWDHYWLTLPQNFYLLFLVLGLGFRKGR